jgi:hypothetical protein
MMRSLVIAMCALAIPCSSWAQGSLTSWADLNSLQPGQKIQVIQMNSKKDTGTFLDVSDTAIALQEKSGAQTIQKQDVRIVKLMKNTHRLRNTLIGAAAGAGVGAGIGAATYRPCKPPPGSYLFTCLIDFGRGPQSAFGAAVGLVGGAVTGALWPSHKILYRVGGTGA